MGSYISRHQLDTHCQPYKDQFSRTHLGQSISENVLPSPERRKATKASESVWYQKMSNTPYLVNGEDPEILARKDQLTPEEKELLKTPKGIVFLNRTGIELAIDRRIALFFQQAIVCYKMPFYFYSVGADEQFGSSSVLKFSDVTHKRQAAHSSTFPALMAYPKNQTRDEAFKFLKGGSYEAQQNGTIGMHVYINNTDSALDGAEGDGKLRDRAIEILNNVADGLSPVEATKQFMGALIDESNHLMDLWSESSELPEATKYRVAKRYKKLTEASLEESNETYFFDRMIGLKTTDETDDKVREIFFKRRYHIVQLQETVESRIAKKISDAKAEMAVRDRYLLEQLLVKEFSENSNRKILEKLFSKSCVPFDADYQAIPNKTNPKNYKSFLTRVNNLREKHKTLVSSLSRDLRAAFRELSCAEMTMRSKVFKDMRLTVKNWRGQDFCDEYYEKTGWTVSKTWVSRVEQLSRVPMRTEEDYKSPLNQRRRYLTVREAKNCAKTFGVDKGLFLAAMITSD